MYINHSHKFLNKGPIILTRENMIIKVTRRGQKFVLKSKIQKRLDKLLDESDDKVRDEATDALDGFNEGDAEKVKDFKELKKTTSTPQKSRTRPLRLDSAWASLGVEAQIGRADVGRIATLVLQR